MLSMRRYSNVSRAVADKLRGLVDMRKPMVGLIQPCI